MTPRWQSWSLGPLVAGAYESMQILQIRSWPDPETSAPPTSEVSGMGGALSIRRGLRPGVLNDEDKPSPYTLPAGPQKCVKK